MKLNHDIWEKSTPDSHLFGSVRSYLVYKMKAHVLGNLHLQPELLPRDLDVLLTDHALRSSFPDFFALPFLDVNSVVMASVSGDR